MAIEEETPVLESALERFRERDTLRRSGKGTPLARFARGVSDGVPEQITLEGFIKSSLVLPPSLVVGFIAGLGKIGGNFASLARLVDQKEVDKLFAVANADWAETTAKFVGDDDPAAKRAAGLMTTVGTAGGGMVSYAVPAIGFARLFNQAFKVRPLLATLYADALVGFGGMSPEEENIFNVIKEKSEEGDVKWLADIASIISTDPNSSEFGNRIANAGEAVIFLGASEAAIKGLKKLSRAFFKAKNTEKTIDAIKKELPPEQADKLEQILEPDPKNPNKLGATVDEVEEITGKPVEEKPDPIDTQTDEMLVEEALPIGADDLDTVVNKPSITPEEFLEKWKTPEDTFNDEQLKIFGSQIDPNNFDEFLDALKKAKTADDYNDLYNVLDDIENFTIKAELLVATEKQDKEFASKYLDYLLNTDPDKYMTDASNMADTLKNNKVATKNHSILGDSIHAEPDFKKEFDKKAKEIQQQIDDAKMKLEKEQKAKIDGTEINLSYEGYSPDVQKKLKQVDKMIEAQKNGKTKKSTIPSEPEVNPLNPKMKTFKVTGKKPGGSSDGAEITDTDTGIKYIAKYPKNIEQAAQEALASRVYQLAGVYTPEVKVITATVDGKNKTMLVSEFIEDLKPYNPDTVSPMEMGRLHATAAILRDWDAVGLSKDNIVFVTLPNGQTRLAQIDAGGSLEFRAQGEFKDGDFSDKAIEEWESIAKANKSVFKGAYAKDSIAYMKGVEDAITRLSRIPEGTLSAREVESYASAGIKSTKDLSKVITDRINNLKYDLEEAIDIHGGLNIPTKTVPVEGTDAVIKDATFEPSTKNIDKAKIDAKKKTYIKKKIATYKNLPETKAKKLGFDPSSSISRFEQLAGVPNKPTTISATVLPEKDFVALKTSKDKSEIGVGEFDVDDTKFPVTPLSSDKYLSGKIQDVYDEELTTNLKFRDKNTEPAPLLIKGNIQTLQSKLIEKLKEIKDVDKTIKLMLDPHGSTMYNLSKFRGSKEADVKAYGRPTGVFYSGPAVNNAYIFQDGITSGEVTKLKNTLEEGARQANQGIKGGTPIKFLTLGKSINFHVPSNIMGSTLPLNPNYKELRPVYDKIKNSITDLETTPQGKDIIQSYTDLIFTNAYGSKMALALKKSYLGGSIAPKGRITKFDYSPTTPQGKEQYKEFFGDSWLEETDATHFSIKGWSQTEGHGEAVNIFLTSLNKGAKNPNDVFLTIPVDDELTSHIKNTLGTQYGRIPYSQATLSPVQAKDVVREASPALQVKFRVGDKGRYISTIKPIVFKTAKPNEIDSKKSALFNSNIGLNVMKQYLGPIAVGASFIPMLISDEAKAEEVAVGPTEEEELGFTPVMDETVSDKLLTGGMMPEEQPVEAVGEEETPLANFPVTEQDFSYEDVIAKTAVAEEEEEDNDELDIDAQMNDLNLGEQVDDGQFNYVQ